MFWSRGPELPEEWPEVCGSLTWLVLELCTVLALTQLGIRQSDWWRAWIRSTNLHIMVESEIFTVDTPKLADKGEIWDVFCELKAWPTVYLCNSHSGSNIQRYVFVTTIFFDQYCLLQCIHLSRDYSMSLSIVWLSLQNKWRTFIRNGMFSTNNKNYKLIKTISGNIQGPGSIQKHCLIRIGIHIVEIWWSSDYLISSMSIPFLISHWIPAQVY